MNRLVFLLENHPVVFLHLATAVSALLLGLVILLRRKGTGSHRALGWAWVVLMAVAALSTVFIRDYRLPNLAGYTPIHAFTVWTAILLPLGVAQARRGRLQAHRRTMRGLFVGGCLVAGMLALLPGRFLGRLLWQGGFGLAA